MAFPADPLPLIGEIQLAGDGGAWTKITELGGTGKVRAAQEVTISRGRRNVQGNLPPGTADFTIDNRDGLFTNRNPLSPYYRKLPRYTPVRFRLNDPGIPSYGWMNGGSEGDRYETSRSNITGDIDIRIDIEPFQWSPSRPNNAYANDNSYIVLASQIGNTSTEYGWVLMLKSDNRLWFSWSPDGTFANRRSFFSSTFVPTGARMAFRVTLQVNNGAAQCVARFYSAATIDDTFVQFAAFSQAGITSIYGSGGFLEIGSLGGGLSFYANTQTYGGRVYAFALRNGIGGAVVANADFRALAPESGVFTDSAGKSWGYSGYSNNGSDAVRFVGEIESLPQEWDLTGKENVVPAHAADPIYRFSVSNTELLSSIEQYVSGIKTLTAYWPLQDEGTATLAASKVPNSAPAVAYLMRFQGDTTLAGADGAVSMGDQFAYLRGVAATSTTKGVTSALLWFKLTTVPSVPTKIISFGLAGSNIKEFRISIDSANFTFEAFAADGSSVFSGGAAKQATTVLTQWTALYLESSDAGGGNITCSIKWQTVGAVTGSALTVAAFAGTVGLITSFTAAPGTNAPDVAYSNLAIFQEKITFDPFGSPGAVQLAGTAYLGELAGVRFLRLCKLAGITPTLEGWAYETDPMGPQRVATVLDLLRDAEKTDGGILSGTRWRKGLTYVTRACISGRYSTMTLSHSASQLSFAPKPVEDSFGIFNDFTASRQGGSSYRNVVSTGSLGTAALGNVPGTDTYAARDDSQLASLAGWQTSLGTWDEARFPDVQVALERQQTLLGGTLAASCLKMDIGRNFVMTGLPAHQPPGPYELMTQGYSEALGNRTARIDWSTTPYGPWRGYRFADPFITPRFQATDTSILAAGSTDTLLTFVTPGSTKKLLTSGTFEEPGAAALAAWFAVSCTISQSNVVANSGTYSMLMTVTGAPAFCYARQLDPFKPKVTVGTRYRCYIIARTPVASPDVAAVIDWYDSSYVYISSSSTTTALLANTWTYIQIDAVAPVGAAYAAYGPTVGSSPATGKLIYVDDVTFFDLSVPSSTRWITSTELPSAFPMNIMIGGELMTMTALINQGMVQTATVNRSQNGIVKAQVDGEAVQLASITTFGR